MSAPKTDIEKQKRRHRGPLVGIVAVAVIALAGWLFLTGNPAEEEVLPADAPSLSE